MVLSLVEGRDMVLWLVEERDMFFSFVHIYGFLVV